MNLPLSYRDFLKAKIVTAPVGGFVVEDAEINPLLKPHQRAIVKWACLGGRRAIFAAFGLGKTIIQLEIMRLVGIHCEGPTLIVAPLGVRQEFLLDAHTLATGDHPDITDAQRAELAAWLDGHPERAPSLKFIRRTDEVAGGQAGRPVAGGVETAADEVTPVSPAGAVIHLTNYETIREGKLDVRLFAAASLDEASVLRGFGGTKTFREFMKLFDGMAYKFVATATPSPNEYIELLAYSAFLEVMDIGQAKTRFFKRNSEKADSLTIHPHKEREFWLWVASWGLFIEKPSDLGFSDEGYDLPGIDIYWHELPSDHSTAGEEKSGQKRLLKNAAASLPDAAREKRESIRARVAKMMELRALDPDAHRVIWHDLEAERLAIQAALPTSRAVWGTQDLDEREKRLTDFAYGRLAELSTKPVIAGSGTNLQRYCWWEIFVGIGFKFNDLIQAIYRVNRFLQKHRVRIDLIYTEAEKPIRDAIEAKWRRHDEQRRIMTSIIREFGLSAEAMSQVLQRGMGVPRVEVSSAEDGYHLVNADCVEEVGGMAADSVDLIVTSIPFSTQYEYSPNYADFGHSDTNEQFFEQMDYLIPQLFRVLRPGRVAAIHVKDRIVPGGLTGLGFQTLYPFSDETVVRFKKHGFAFLSRKTIVTDVVRENNQTNRLGWTEQCKDGSRMGNGLPEYLLVFRKPQSDTSKGYADKPVHKAKKEWHAGEWLNPEGYSRGRWQLDAHGFTRSSGNRLITPAELRGLDAKVIYKLWRAFSLSSVYDFEHHVTIAEGLEEASSLPSDFMLIPPHSWHGEVWGDIARMLSMNTLQAQAGREMHLCPLQFDIVDRCIVQYSEPGETVLDPFAGLMTVPFRALKHKRRGVGVELNPGYFADGAAYVEAMARDMAVPDLFGMLEATEPSEAAR